MTKVDEFEFDAEQDVITVGRRSSNDVAIPNLSISGNHAKISFSDGKAWLEDRKSTNGTYVNGEVIQRHQIRNGDDIILGKIRMGVLLSSVPAPALADGFEDDDDIEEDLDAGVRDMQDESMDSSRHQQGSTANAEGSHQNAIDTDDGPVDADEMSFDEDARLFAQPPVETVSDANASNEDSVISSASDSNSDDERSHPLDGIDKNGGGIAAAAGAVAAISAGSRSDDADAPPMHELDSPSSTSNGAVIEIKNGAKSGQILPIDKPVTTLGRPGIQIAAIMRKPDGYFLMHIESDDSVDRPTLNRDAIGDEPVLLHSGDELNVAGIDVEFMLS